MVPEPTHGPPGGTPDDHVEADPGVTLDLTAVDTTTNALAAATVPDAGTTHLGLDSIERTILHARIAALERALDAKDRQRAAIVDQYEAILAERNRAAEDERGLLDTLQTLL